ncbi:MAG: hypothetical protein WCG03_01400 [Kiritimatiellales bacterium]
MNSKIHRLIPFPGILIAITALFIVMDGCSPNKLTETEARRRAEVQFEHHCKVIIHYETNEFNPPELHVGRGDGDELCYQYIWKHKSENLEVVVGVGESGTIVGDSGPIDHDKPLPPQRKKTDRDREIEGSQ